ncbi:MAG: PadR family transcriptional regulator [Candidatus Woesearchaeota archaeon]|nr:MAG: PadR family transcriptional regulator [Candidatus Woesearchaeota archaeon]
MKNCCDMRGFLSFIVLRLISRKSMSGEEIRKEIEIRRGTKPSPGTIYPVLKSLSNSNFIHEIKARGKIKKYELTLAGKKELKVATRRFIAIFCDMQEEFEKIREHPKNK